MKVLGGVGTFFQEGSDRSPKARKSRRQAAAFSSNYLDFFSCSHCWFATLQEVLLADWQEVWHSPQPPFLADASRFLEFRVLILFMIIPPVKCICFYYGSIKSGFCQRVLRKSSGS
jgi:hypothetical protein